MYNQFEKYNYILFLTLRFLSYSQEICDNGIDDDGDGFIDLNDTAACNCGIFQIEPYSLIQNPSFEDTFCCPFFYSSLVCAKDWMQASLATSDYFNTCGFIGDAVNVGRLAPIPVFGGSGYVGFIDGTIPYTYKE